MESTKNLNISDNVIELNSKIITSKKQKNTHELEAQNKIKQNNDQEKEKKIKFDYAQIYSYTSGSDKKTLENEQLFQLEDFLKFAKSLDVSKLKFPYYGEDVILKEITKIDNSSLWKLHFIRIRAAELPVIINNSSNEFKHIDLDDDEYIGEEISVLYDAKRYVMMTQRNRNALGLKGIESFINQALNDINNIIRIKPIPIANDIKTLKNCLLRKFEVSYANVKSNNANPNSALWNFLSSSSKMNSFRTTISFSIGNGRKKESLTSKEISQFLELSDAKKIHLEYKRHEDAPIEIVEFINGHLTDEEYFKYSKTNYITSDKICDTMISLYNSKISNLDKLLEYKD